MLQKSCLLVKDRNDVVAHECVVLVVWGGKRECLQKMLPRDEVAKFCIAVDIAKVGDDLE